MSPALPIGLFDSGVGGLTVLKEMVRQLPQESTVYFGDTARVPYGSKSRDVIIRFSMEISEFLMKEKIKMLVVACNTASAFALKELRAKFAIPIIGVIAPGAHAAKAATRTRRIGVIGTEGTIESKAYADAIHYLDPDIEVLGQACPLIVPLVEEGWLDKPLARDIVKEYLVPLLKQKIDTLVLGCTHYPLLKNLLADVAGPSVTLIDSAEETARRVGLELQSLQLTAAENQNPKRHFFVSDAPERFARTGARFLGQSIDDVHLVDIGEWI